MTELDAALPGQQAVNEPGVRAGIWRVISFALTLAATLIIAIWVLQSRAASDIAVENSRTLDVVAAEVTIADMATPVGARVSVLGLSASSFVPLDASGVATIDLPSRVGSLVALRDDGGDIFGLTIVSRAADREPVVISPATTAHALIALSPAMLEADLERSRERADFIASEPAVLELVDALTASPNITAPNAAVEEALAAILDRVQVSALPDQGCDSILNSRAVAVTGACAEPTSDDATTIHNEQDRWMLAFAGPAPYTELCASIAPAGAPGSKRTITTDGCGGEVLLAAPGPIIDRSDNRREVIARVHAAAGVQLYAAYAAPLADLAGGVAGLNRESNSHVLARTDRIVDVTTRLANTDPGFVAALDVIVASSTRVERHAATIAAARLLLGDGDELIDEWDPGESTHLALLDFYDRAGERMLDEERSDWRWAADSWGVVGLEAGS